MRGVSPSTVSSIATLLAQPELLGYVEAVVTDMGRLATVRELGWFFSLLAAAVAAARRCCCCLSTSRFDGCGCGCGCGCGADDDTGAGATTLVLSTTTCAMVLSLPSSIVMELTVVAVALIPLCCAPLCLFLGFAPLFWPLTLVRLRLRCISSVWRCRNCSCRASVTLTESSSQPLLCEGTWGWTGRGDSGGSCKPRRKDSTASDELLRLLDGSGAGAGAGPVDGGIPRWVWVTPEFCLSW